MRGNTRLSALLSLLLLSAPAHAGVRWQRAVGPEGADVYSLAGGGGALWAGTLRGVWKLSGPESGPVWSFDGLPDRTVTGVAIF